MGDRHRRRRKAENEAGWRPTRRKAWAYIWINTGRDIALIRGPRPAITAALDNLGIRYGWSAPKRGWTFDSSRVPDIEAYAQHLGTFVTTSTKEPPP
jgi:hypothetical protein